MICPAWVPVGALNSPLLTTVFWSCSSALHLTVGRPAFGIHIGNPILHLPFGGPPLGIGFGNPNLHLPFGSPVFETAYDSLNLNLPFALRAPDIAVGNLKLPVQPHASDIAIGNPIVQIASWLSRPPCATPLFQ